MYHVYRNQATAYLSLQFFICLSLQFSNIKIFRHTVLTNYEVQKIETRYTRGQWVDVSCILESGCCCLFVLLFLHFLSLQFSNIKIFCTLTSGTVRPRRLKLGTHVDRGWMYGVYQNQAAAAYSSLFFFFLQDSNIKIFVILFLGTVRPRRLKLGAHMDNGWMYRVYQNQAAAAYLFLYFFIFLSLQFSNIKMFCHTFLRNCEAQKVETLYPRGQWVDESCIPKIFITFFSRTGRDKKLKQCKVTNMKNKYNVLCILKSGCSYFFILLFLPFSVFPIFSLY